MTSTEYQKQRLNDPCGSYIAKLAAVIREYMETEGTGYDCALRDTLTDIRHLCDIEGLDYAAIDDRAHEVYTDEQAEAGWITGSERRQMDALRAGATP